MTFQPLIRAAIALLAAFAILHGPAYAGPSPSPFPKRFAAAPDGARIAFYASHPKAGRPPIVIISGGPGSDHRYMNAGGAFERLAATRQVVMYDQRATGSSAPAPKAPTIDIWVSDIEAIRRELGAERIDLLGHSFGGYLAMAYAAAHPERARSLVLVDSSQPDPAASVQLMNQLYPDRVESWRRLRDSLDKPFRAEQIALFYSMEFVDPQWTERYVSHVTGLIYDVDTNTQLRADMDRHNLHEKVATITAPVLVVHGRFDAILATSNSWAISRLLKNARLEMFGRSGHMPFIEQAELFVQRIENFLAAVDRPAR